MKTMTPLHLQVLNVVYDRFYLDRYFLDRLYHDRYYRIPKLMVYSLPKDTFLVGPFHEDSSGSFYVNLVTDRQTNK